MIVGFFFFVIINWIKGKPEIEKEVMQTHEKETKEIINDLQLET